MLPIRIDLDEVVGEFSLSGEETNLLGAAIIDRVIEEYYQRWRDLVGKELRQSRAEYLKAMYVERTSPLEVVFGLSARESELALMVEEGASPFDEKPGFERSSKAKQKRMEWVGIFRSLSAMRPQKLLLSQVFSIRFYLQMYTI